MASRCRNQFLVCAHMRTPNDHAHALSVAAIDRAIADSLYKMGAILPTNFNDLSKIVWSRSSRTDKGVRALMFPVTSLHCLLPTSVF
jgi:hypothetical protein